MPAKKVKVTIVELKQPCTACLITGDLLRGIIDKISRELDYLEIQNIILDDLKHVHDVKGLEVESFPAVIINEEQITAGSLPMRDQLISIIKYEALSNADC